MANTKQAKKMIRKNQTRTTRNRLWKTRIKNAIKSLSDDLQQKIDKGAKTGALHRNKARRLQSRASKKKNHALAAKS